MANRGCKDCGLCCKVMAIKELKKPAGTWCMYWEKGVGCTIYQMDGKYPQECADFECMYIATEQEIPQIFPKKLKAVIAKCNVVPDQGGLGVYKDKEFLWANNPSFTNLIRNHANPIWVIAWWEKKGLSMNPKAVSILPSFDIEDDFDDD